MASNGKSDSNHLNQSSQSVSSATAAKSKGGRPPHPIRKEFHDVGSSDNSSKRGACDCKHCSTHFTAQLATVANLIKHIVSDCSNCPCDTRQTWQLAHAGAQATSTNGEAAVQAGVKRKRQTTLDSTMATQALQMTKMQRQAVDFHLLRWAICNNIPFQAFNDVHFFAAINGLRPHYQVPSPTTFKEKLLQQEYLGVMCKLQDRIARAQNLTLSGDGWTNAAKHSVVAFTLQFPDRTSALLETRDVSADKHTAEMLAGAMHTKQRAVTQSQRSWLLWVVCSSVVCLTPCPAFAYVPSLLPMLSSSHSCAALIFLALPCLVLLVWLQTCSKMSSTGTTSGPRLRCW